MWRPRGERLMPLIVGIDENGYGPVMGPLVATAVGVKVESQKALDLKAVRACSSGLPVDDSKRLFRSRKRSRGEEAALALLESIGLRPSDFGSLLEGLLPSGIESLRRFCCGDLRFCFKELPLPVWCKAPKELVLGAEVCFIKLTVACPKRFNLLLRRLKSKALVDLYLFSELWEALPRGEWEVLCGKVGGMRRYGKALEALGWEVFLVLSEKGEESSYVVARGEKKITVRFIKDADEKLLPVAAASIIGKYVRELSMTSILEALSGLLGEKVEVSGYRDERTMRILERVKGALPRLGLSYDCLIRAK